MYNKFTRHRTKALMLLLLGMMLVMPTNRAIAQKGDMSIDIFSGAEFSLRDISFNRQYDVYLCVTPGFKWNFGDHWQVAGQMFVDIINQYKDPYYDVYYGYQPGWFHFGILDVSKELKLGELYCKASAGFFTCSRYGVDLKMFLPVTDWFALEAQGGCTGRFVTYGGIGFSPMQRFSGTIGGDIYLPGSNTQLRGVVGAYIYRDLGAEVEVIRHFRHSSVSLYANWNNKGTTTIEQYDGGFRVVVMLPPYHRKQRTVNIRPASNYTLPYSINVHQWSNRMYNTDPEENMRDGWFSRDLLDWGSHTMEPDSIITPKE